MSQTISNRTGWVVERKAGEFGMGREVFRAPDGTEYERCTPDKADLTISFADSRHRGLPDLPLRKRGWQAKNLKREAAAQ